jgi:cytochrome c biogenesis protein CcmG, thiol:disulfide interchange protein DsbE
VKRLLLMAAFTCAACTNEPAPLPGAVDTPAPAYGALTMQGDSVDLTTYRGSVVLLNVWATWCIPCRREVPELQALHQQYGGQGLRVLGVSIDGGDADADVTGFMSDFKMTYTVLRDPAERVLSTFRIVGVPASYLIDREGIVRWRTIGPFTAGDARLQAALRRSL